MNKEIDYLIKKAREQGWTILKTKNNHYKWMSPLGGLFYSASTPSDHRAVDNIKHDLKVYGFIELKRKGKRNK